jgi:hypothetical protein
MSLRIKAVVENFVRDLKAALEADIQDRIMKEREKNSYLDEREREVAEREAAWKAELSRREVCSVLLFLASKHHAVCSRFVLTVNCLVLIVF